MIRCYLFLIVFSTLQLHLTFTNNESEVGRKNTFLNTPMKNYHGWRRWNMGRGNSIRREKKNFQQKRNGIKSIGKFQTSVYETAPKRQMLFYNIYINNSPNIYVKNIFSKEETLNPIRDDLTYEDEDSSSIHESSGRSLVNVSNSATMEKEFTDLNHKLSSNRDSYFLLKGRNMRKMSDVLEVKNLENETRKNPIFEISFRNMNADVWPLFKNQTINRSGNSNVITVIHIGNNTELYRLKPTTDITDKTEDIGIANYKNSQLIYPSDIQININSSNVTQNSSLTSLNITRNNELINQENMKNWTIPVLGEHPFLGNSSALMFNNQRWYGYPSYGTHTYHEIMRYLQYKKLGKIKEKDIQE